MRTILSCMIIACAALCISCADDPPPTQNTVREIHYYPAQPTPRKPTGPEAFEPVKRF